MADIKTIKDQFIGEYYVALKEAQNSDARLKALYRPHSMLTYEEKEYQGKDDIVGQLARVSFDCKVTACDAQPSSPSVASLLINVTGTLLSPGQENPLLYNEVFQLVPDESGYYIFNHIFRLNYG